MDHRRSKRQASDLCVVIRYRRVGLLSCRARDVSAEGMQVEAGVVSIPEDTYVRLHVNVRGGVQPRTFSCGAWVNWSSDGCMGLRFEEPQHGLMEALGERRAVAHPVEALAEPKRVAHGLRVGVS